MEHVFVKAPGIPKIITFFFYIDLKYQFFSLHCFGLRKNNSELGKLSPTFIFIKFFLRHVFFIFSFYYQLYQIFQSLSINLKID